MKGFLQLPSTLFLLGALSSLPLFGIYMYFGPIVVIATPIYALYLFLNNGESALKTIQSLASFVCGALVSWITIYFAFITKHI
jgi:hypothetical protein